MAEPADQPDRSELAELVDAYYRDLWGQHRNDPAMGLCPCCRVADCEPGRLAYARLFAAGVAPPAELSDPVDLVTAPPDDEPPSQMGAP